MRNQRLRYTDLHTCQYPAKFICEPTECFGLAEEFG